MSTPESPALPGPVAIPLSTELRQAYQDLYASIEAAIEGTRDAAVLQALNARQGDVDDVLTQDDMYKLNVNTGLFNALQQQIKDTNEGLQMLEKQMASIAAGFNDAGQVMAAINKVLSLIPGIS